MAEIFISYSREDRDWVERLASQLQSEGFSVWWDWDLLVGKRYRETIDSELQTCKAAVVVWSQHSIQSDFVRDEAEEAQQRNILVPVLKEVVRPPAGFRQIQTADLSTWTGEGSHAEFRRVMRGVGYMVGRPATGDSSGTATADTHALQPAARVSPTAYAGNVNFAKTASTPTQAKTTNASALLSRLPPASHRIWRYAAFAIVALIGVLLIVSYFPSTSSKPAAPAPAVASAPAPVNAATPVEGADIGQTGPHNASTPPAGNATGDSGQTGPHNTNAPPAGNATGDSGDVGQGNAH